MKVVNCIALTRGDLSGKPSFSAFEEIKVALSQINRGDLFIAGDADDIPLALKRGAYGIIYDFDYEPHDDEIAWIKVRDTKSAAIVIAKYLLLKKQIRFVTTDSITFEIARKINSEDSVVFLNTNDLVALFSAIKNDNKSVYIGHDDEYFQELTSEPVESYFVQKENGFHIINETMFETTLLDNDTELVIRLPHFMLKYLRNAQKIFTELNLTFTIEGVKSQKFFDPVFVDDNLKEREFGRTSKVMIFSEFDSLIFLRECIDFVKEKGRWGRLLFLLPSELVGFEHNDTIITHFGSDEELSDMLEDADFNFAFLVGANRKMISKEKKEQLSLF